VTESTPARTAALVPAAGRGERLGPGAPKALREIGGEPILLHAVRGLFASGRVDLVVVAAPPTNEGVAEVRRMLAGLTGAGATGAGAGTGAIRVVPGGATRQQSVALALAAVPEDGYEVVLVHDAARALTPPATIAAVVDAVLAGSPAVIPVLPVADTIKSAHVDEAGRTIVGQTVDRSGLRAVQTPQGFRRDVLARAHAAAGHDATDDAGLVESLGEPVGMIPGHVEAFKVTTPFDLVLAEAVLARRAADAADGDNADDRHEVPQADHDQEPPTVASSLPLVGIGVDVHAFAKEEDLAVEPRPLRLAGLDWPGQSGLLGHSDADVVAHAACNALFSAAGLGDLGSNFGTDQPEWKGAAGTVLLAEAARRVREAGYVIGNIAVQLVGVRPKLGPRRAEAEAVLAEAVGAPVRLSAATTDGLGFTGRAEGLTGIATAVIFPAG
jgi:2-C-methyl-D-erythritol 4-phosphate cytidylyltransferase/2-C-methyl-D-erythritol 2,4-cyclodiphosphate synthase